MIMLPNGPADDDPTSLGGFVPAQPVLPSRATGEPKPLTPLPDAMTPERRRQAPRPPRPIPKKAPKRAAKKAAPKPRRKTVAKKKAEKAAPPAAPKNPNRPLEAKTRLHAVLGVVATLSKQESVAFSGMMSHLEDMTGPARRKVIDALARVYA